MSRIHQVPQGVRFLVAGGFAALINWLARFPLSLVMPFAAAVAVAGAIGMVVGFISYRHYVFPGSTRGVGHQLRDFVIVNIVSTALVTALAVLLASRVLPALAIDWHDEAIAHAIAIGLGAFFNFFAHRLFSFRQPDPLSNDIR